MSVLIVYAGRTGTTHKAASLLAGRLPGASLCNLAVRTPDLSRYDTVIIGSAVRGGRIMRCVRRFIADNYQVLLEKRTGLFICHAFLEMAPQLLRGNFPVELRNSSLAVDSFGGELDEASLKGKDRLLLRILRSRYHADSSVRPVLLTDRIELFAREMKGEAEPGPGYRG